MAVAVSIREASNSRPADKVLDVFSVNRFTTLLMGVVVVTATGCNGHPRSQEGADPKADEALPFGKGRAKPRLDLSGRARSGTASVYAKEFAGRQMADGAIMDPRANNAASTTLPLGTIARVTNTETGQSAQVTIQDRGPYVRGRLIDLSSSTAREIGITQQQGIGTVTVAPISIPLPDGGTKNVAINIHEQP